MYYEDFLMKQIDIMIRTIVNLILRKDITDISVIKYRESTDQLYKEIAFLLKNMYINEAEDLLFNKIDKGKIEDLEFALEFYKYLNNLTDEELDKNNFAREEIELGLKDIMEMYNVNII